MATTVVNIRRDAFDVYIGRAGHGQDGYYGNPYRLIPGRSREAQRDMLDRFREYFLRRVTNDAAFRSAVIKLRGKRLGCFCVRADGSGECHGKIIKEFLDSEEAQGAT